MVAEKLLSDFLGEDRQHCINPAVWQGRLWAGVSTTTSWLNAAAGEVMVVRGLFLLLLLLCHDGVCFGGLCGVCFLLCMFSCIFKERLQSYCKRGKFSYSVLMVTC